MQIGAFAALCQTKLSVLRYYDREGVLVPAYVDPVTGYRHYDAAQAAVFRRITALRRAGFSIAAIRQMLAVNNSDAAVLALFARREDELREMLSDLEEAKAMMQNQNSEYRFPLTLTGEGENMTARTAPISADDIPAARDAMDNALRGMRYQRISGCRVQRTENRGEVRLTCRVTVLDAQPHSVWEDTDLPFTDDPSVIGRWDVVGEYVHRDDIPESVFSGTETAEEGLEVFSSLYFLPGGEQYWCWGWTRGKLLCRFGDSAYVCDYSTERIGEARYMFVDWKSYEYRCGGKPVVLLLRQHDNAVYTKESLARHDNIDLAFTDDPWMHGTWRAVGLVTAPAVFDPAAKEREGLFFSEVTFSPGGAVTSRYGAQTIAGADMQVWTKGYILRKWNSTACACDIRVIDGVEYLFIAWKSGDYIWGGREHLYYVFRRASS
ncbi:MAG: MerR family transcriptional regulator [Clostridia bacterium]|nr:MerR family transcriptional regulator [Clostridia bacterium]